MIFLVLVNSHLFPLPCGAGSTVPREGFNLSFIILASLFVFLMLGCRHYLLPHCNISRFSFVLYPPSSEAAYCYICSRGRVAVARYRMICLVLDTIFISYRCVSKCLNLYTLSMAGWMLNDL